MGEIYYCKNCGGVMEFDVATQSLKCPNCGTEEKIEANRQTVKEQADRLCKKNGEGRRKEIIHHAVSILRSDGGSGSNQHGKRLPVLRYTFCTGR